MNFVCVDLGASGTRYADCSGKLGMIPNNMRFIEKRNADGAKVVDLEPVNMEIDGDDILNRLEVIIEHPNEYVDENIPDFANKRFPVHAIIGNLADRVGSTVYPSGNRLKTHQIVNHVSFIVAMALARIEHGVEENIRTFLALPPNEAYSVGDLPLKLYGGIYTVTFPKLNGGTTVNINIEDVYTYPESAMALFSYFFTTDSKPTDAYKKYATGTVLSIDIGASTTDLIVSKGGNFMDKSAYTIKFGGNLVRERLKSKLQGYFGGSITIDELNTAMTEGRVLSGGGDVYADVSQLLTEAKQEVAERIVSEMTEYFNDCGIPIRTITAIVVSGGGSMHSQYIDENNQTRETTHPMSTYIADLLKADSNCSGINVISHSSNPRMANILGLYTRAKLVEFGEKKKAGEL